MKHKDTTPGVSVTDVLPLPPSNLGLLRWTLTASSPEGMVTETLVVSRLKTRAGKFVAPVQDFLYHNMVSRADRHVTIEPKRW